jgi:hypothetical protein
MNATLKKIVATVAVAGAITAGTAGAAFAADSSSGPASGSGTGAATTQTGRHPGVRAAVRKGAFKIVLDTLGVSKEELKGALQGGQSISEYATSLGKDPQAVVDALTNAANTRVDQAVANGRIQQDRADTIKSKIPTRVDTFVHRHFGQHTGAQAPSATNS